MAHGYLTPEAVSGEGLGIPYKRLYEAFKKLFRKDLRVVNANVKEVRDLLPGGKDRAQLPPAGQKMLGGAATKNAKPSLMRITNAMLSPRKKSLSKVKKAKPQKPWLRNRPKHV